MFELMLLLMIVHFVVDYQFQSDFVALNKNRKFNKTVVPWYYVMLSHCCCHALPLWFLLNPFYAVAELICHFIIDVAKCEGFTNIHVDQFLHMFCKASWVFMVYKGVGI